MNDATRLICHRGHHAAFPENTLDAFQAAVDIGADGVETDLRMTSDGQLVLFHDRVLANGQPVSSLSRGELAAAAGHDVPRMIDALDACPDLLWLLEIKSPDAAAPMLAALRSLNRHPKLIVFSIWHNVVAQLVHQCYHALGVTIWHRPSNVFAFGDSIPADSDRISTLVFNYEFLDAEMVAQARANEYDVAVFNTHNERDHEHCVNLEVDMVITDFPEMLSGLREWP
jgi:glycerophosphoryl diester phosphodiesterase